MRPGGFSGGPAQGGFGGRPPKAGLAVPPAAAARPRRRRCACTFPSIREEVEKGAAGIRAAGERKATREEVCPLFKAFAVKEAKLVKFLETNQKTLRRAAERHHPGQAEPRQDHPDPQQRVQRGPAGAAGPTLSDALGGPVIADDTSARPGRGTFDTLTGNALQR